MNKFFVVSLVVVGIMSLNGCVDTGGEDMGEFNREELVLEYLNEKYGEEFELSYASLDDMLASTDTFGATVLGHNEPEDYFTVFGSGEQGSYYMRDNYFQQLALPIYVEHMEPLLLQVVDEAKFDYVLGESANVDTAVSAEVFEDLEGTGFQANVYMYIPVRALKNRDVRTVMEEISELVIQESGILLLGISIVKDEFYEDLSMRPDDKRKADEYRNQFVSQGNNLFVNGGEIVFLNPSEE